MLFKHEKHYVVPRQNTTYFMSLEVLVKKCCFLFGLILVLGSCETQRYSVSITNESSKTVRFSYDGSTDNLAPSGSKVYSVAAYTQPPVFLETIPKGPRSIGMKNSGDVYEFIDLDEIALNVFNKLPFDIEISAGDFIDGGGNKTSVVVPANTTNNTGSIYTSNPKFTVVPQGYSAQVTYKIEDNTMYVTIK
jgi:hypothetical protein